MDITRKVVDYNVILGAWGDSGSERQFNADVKSALSAGWELYGGISISYVGDWTYLAQAVVKYAPHN